MTPTSSVVFHINRTFRRDRLEVGLTDSIWPYGKPLKARLPRRLNAPTVGADLGKVADIPCALRLALAL